MLIKPVITKQEDPPPRRRLTLESLVLEPALGDSHSPRPRVALTSFVSYNCCHCRSKRICFACCASGTQLARIYSFISSLHKISLPPRNMRSLTVSSPLCPKPPLARSYHLPHPCRHSTSRTQTGHHPYPPPRPCLLPTLSNGTCSSGRSKKSPTGWPFSGHTSASISRVLES